MHEENLKQFEIISFDIFDTLVKRQVNCPKDVFYILERQLCLKYGDQFKNFEKQRIQAEQKARDNKQGEITIYDIYSYIKLDATIDINEIICEEERLEYNLCIPNEKGIELYKYCLNNKKKIAICSDMYWSRETILNILKKCGIEKFQYFLLSSEELKTKKDGELFRRLIEISDVAPNRILHIGDNIKSDIFQAKRNGINVIWMPKKIYRYNYTIEDYLLYGDLKKRNVENYWSVIGKECLGNLLYGYSEWIHTKITAKNYEKVFFLARDGYIVQQAMNTIFPNNKMEYLYVSRKSTIIPTLYLYDTYEKKCNCMYWKKRFSIKEFVTNFGLDYERTRQKYPYVREAEGTTFLRKNLYNDSILIKIYNLLSEEINDNSLKAFNNIVGYLKKRGFKGKVAIVDVGWYGNIQNALYNVCEAANINAKIDGYYLGIKRESQYYDKLQMNGYLFFGTGESKEAFMGNIYANFIESLFSSEEGSVQGYKKVKEDYIPILDSNSNRKGMPDILREIHKSALQQVNNLKKMNIQYILKLSAKEYSKGICEVALKPKKIDADLFGKYIGDYKENRENANMFCAKWKPGYIKRRFGFGVYQLLCLAYKLKSVQ